MPARKVASFCLIATRERGEFRLLSWLAFMLVLGMGLSATAKRRGFGVLVLAVALGMLVAGETVLQGRMGGVFYLVYWLVCLCFTVLAMLVALWDARVMRLRSRQQQRDLLETTFDKIITDAKTKREK